MKEHSRSSVADLIEFGFRRRLPVILQSENTECGLACLAMIASYFGTYTELAELRRDNPVSLKGSNLGDIISIAAKLSLSTRAVRLEIASLRALRLPCILHWDFNHFVVLKSVSDRVIKVHDPAVGGKIVDMAEASRSFTGVALEIWPSPDFKTASKTASAKLQIGMLIGKTVGLFPLLAQVLVMALGIELLSLAMPLLSQWIIDYVVVAHDIDLLTTCAIGFALLVCLTQALTLMRNWVLMYVSTSLNIQWQANVLSHLLRLPVEFFQKRHLGDIVSRFGSVEQMQNTLTTSFVTAILDGVMSTATILLMLIYSTSLSLIVLVSVSFYIALRFATFPMMRGNIQTKIVFNARQQTHFLETMRGIKTVKLFQREDLRRSSWLSLFAQQINAGLRSQRVQLLFQAGSGIIFGLERVAVIWLGANKVIEGGFTVGILVAFLSYRDQFGSKINSLTDKYFEFRTLRIYMTRLSDLVLAPPEPDSVGKVTLGPEFNVRIDLQKVGFQYASHEPLVLSDVSFSVLPGEAVAIVGSSGCGKTTLLNMLLGVLEPVRGTISIGGVNIKLLGTYALRGIIGAVTQDDNLFAGSIAENISFFSDRPDKSWVEHCAKLAVIHDDIISMPMGYETLVGDMGTVLSGGQKQRILIARALYRRPRILIFDEATSHLDLISEAKVIRAIADLNITRIIVAHRPETVSRVDRVICLEAGRVSITGRPAILQEERRSFVRPDDEVTSSDFEEGTIEGVI